VQCSQRDRAAQLERAPIIEETALALMLELVRGKPELEGQAQLSLELYVLTGGDSFACGVRGLDSGVDARAGKRGKPPPLVRASGPPARRRLDPRCRQRSKRFHGRREPIACCRDRHESGGEQGERAEYQPRAVHDRLTERGKLRAEQRYQRGVLRGEIHEPECSEQRGDEQQ
jgi:hypothetical protein